MPSTTHGSPERSSFRDLAPALSLLLAACLASPFAPAGARRVTAAPPVYADWWRQMEACARITAPLHRVEWYAVAGEEFATPDGPRWGWWEPPHTVYLAEAHWWDERLVEHEMLHDLLQTGAHPVVFQTCGVQEIREVGSLSPMLPRTRMQGASELQAERDLDVIRAIVEGHFAGKVIQRDLQPDPLHSDE